MTYKIGEVARIAKVSIKTLHHYDAIGLLKAGGRTDSGYRLYTMKDLVRLQQILIYRELEFSCEETHQLMSAQNFDYLKALKQQKTLLEEKQNKLSDVLLLITNMIDSESEETEMSLKEMFEVFPEINTEMIEDEKREWGHTEQHQESMRRAKSYSRADWQKIKEETEALYLEMSELFGNGFSANDPLVLEVIEKQRLAIDKWHFPCSKEFHLALTEMTSSDERYLKNIDKDNPGLARFCHEAAQANLTA